MWRPLVAGAVLVVPLAFTVPHTVRHDVDLFRDHASLTEAEVTVVPPFGFGASRNVPLLLGIRRLVPDDASVSVVPPGDAEARRIFIQTGWIRWVGFAIAPRRVDEGTDAGWVVVVGQTPREAQVDVRRAWRFGRDWLVER